MTPEDLAFLVKVVAAVGLGNIVALVGGWALMKKRVGDLEEWKVERKRADEASRAEQERQQEAWWKVVDAINKTIAALDKSCSNDTTELRTMMKDLKDRVDLHSGSNIANFAGVVRNYSDILVQTLDTLRDTLREARAK